MTKSEYKFPGFESLSSFTIIQFFVIINLVCQITLHEILHIDFPRKFNTHLIL